MEPPSAPARGRRRGATRVLGHAVTRHAAALPPELTRAGAFDTVARTDVRRLSLYLPGMTAPGR
jgi:hypothetical protein